MAPSETGKEKAYWGGREVLIGLSRMDVMDLRLVGRRLKDYIDEEAFVHPEDLVWAQESIMRIVGGIDPWQGK